jgi:hypothetical protein
MMSLMRWNGTSDKMDFIFGSLPELFSGAFCFGGNKSLIPLKQRECRGVINSPIISESGLKTLSGAMDAIGFVEGISNFVLLGTVGTLMVGRLTENEVRSAICFRLGALLR